MAGNNLTNLTIHRSIGDHWSGFPDQWSVALTSFRALTDAESMSYKTLVRLVRFFPTIGDPCGIGGNAGQLSRKT